MSVADGGEGTLAAVAAPAPVTLVDVDTVDALGRPLRASYELLEGDGTAVVEAARTIGLELLDEVDAPVPPRASSAGLGAQLAHALASGSGRVLVALLGDAGAARVYGPQKGATPEQVAHLEKQLARWAAALAAAGRDVGDLPGAGAAGGLGAALLACRATLVPGFSELAQLTGVETAVAGADLVITGAGSLDRRTAMGKAPAGVARLDHDAGALVVGLGGSVERPAPVLVAGR